MLTARALLSNYPQKNNRQLHGSADQIIIEVNLSQIQEIFIDLTSSCSRLKGNTVKNRASKSQEILVTGSIPTSAIKKSRLRV